MVPPNPSSVTEYVPVGVIENVLKVNVLVPVAGFGPNMAKTPGGGFSTYKKTKLLKPPCGVIVIVVAAAEPWATVRLLGEAESRKSGCDGGGAGALTVRLMVVVCVKLPDTPVIAMLPVPSVALLFAVRVRVLELFAGFGLKEAITPLGNPDADRLTPPLKPFAGVIVIALWPLEPCVTVTLLGEVEREKSGCGEGADEFTVRLIVVVCVKLPDTPVTVTVAVPTVAVLLAASVKVLEPVAGLELKEEVTPLGRPDADRLTLLLKPLEALIVIVLLPLAPCVIVRLLGEADKEKSGWLGGGGAEPGQFFTKLAALTVPIPVAKSQPTFVPKAGWYELFEVERTPSKPEGK